MGNLDRFSNETWDKFFDFILEEPMNAIHQMSDEMQNYIASVNEGDIQIDCSEQGAPYDLKGIVDAAKEWIADGWGCTDEYPTPAMIAAALFNEAKTQDICVKAGESHPDFPKALRAFAYQILRLDGHPYPRYGLPGERIRR